MRASRLVVACFLGCVITSCGRSAPDHPLIATARAVLAGPESEEGPAAAGSRLAWMQSAATNPAPPRSGTDVFVRTGGDTIRVNPPGTHAQTGGFDGHFLVLQIVRSGRSRLARFDLRTRRLTLLPRFVNDGDWLWRPDADDNRILYGAIGPGRSAILRYEIRLADLARHRVRVLASLDGHADYAAPGQLRGDWATWVSCPDNTCNVWRENLRTGRRESAPDPAYLEHSQLGPSVDAHGTVFFLRADSSCGNGEIRRWDLRRDTLVLRLPPHTAFQYSYRAKGAPTLYFDLVGCRRSARSDIYELRVR